MDHKVFTKREAQNGPIKIKVDVYIFNVLMKSLLCIFDLAYIFNGFIKSLRQIPFELLMCKFTMDS